MKKYVLCVTTLIALATAVPAQAAQMDFSIGFFGGTPSYTGASLDLSTAFNLGGGTYQVSGVGSGDTTGIIAGAILSILPASFSYGSGTGSLVGLSTNVIKTFTVGVNTFTETLSSIVVTSRSSANQINLELLGVLNGPGFVNTPAGFLLSATQSGGPGATACSGHLCAVSWSATEQSNPPGFTPLPAALPLFASGLGALGLLGWRRKRKNAAAIAAA
jgi:hypothetical protein